MVYQSGYWVWSYTSFFIGSSISFASHDCVVVVGDPNDEDGDGDCDHCGEDVTVGEHGSGHCYGFCDLCGEHVSVGQHGEGICVNVPEYPVLCEYCGEDVSVGEHSVGVCVIDTCNWCGGDLAEGEHGHGVCDVEPPVPCEWCGGNSSEGQHGDGVCNVIPPVVCPWCGGDPSVGAHGFRHGECSHECEVCEWCGGDVSVGQHGDGVCNVHPIPLCEWCKGDPTVGEHGDGVCNKGVEDPPTLPPVPELPEIHLIPPDFEPEEKVERMTFDKFSGLVGERFGSLKEKFHDKFGKGFDELDPRGYAATDVRFQIPWFQGGFVLNVSVREIFAQYRLLFDLLRMIMLALLGIFFVYSATKICFRIL